MKLQAQFIAQKNALFFLDGTPLSAQNCPQTTAESFTKNASAILQSLTAIQVPFFLIGKDEEHYNEAFLASLREGLKTLEENKRYAFIVPQCDKNEILNFESIAASYKHCARRIKDCASIIGFALPEGCSKEQSSLFMEELRQKHGHYLFFCRDTELLLKDANLVRY